MDKSLLILLILVHYRKCVSTYPLENNIIENGDSDLYLKDNLQFFNNPYRKAFENARDVECKLSLRKIFNIWFLLFFYEIEKGFYVFWYY